MLAIKRVVNQNFSGHVILNYRWQWARLTTSGKVGYALCYFYYYYYYYYY